ncbi:MAG TPA: RluA family pseudouridine synthase, partial [Polyangiaceae bacterium]
TAAGERRVSIDAAGMAAHTVFTLERRLAGFSLLAAELKTGRTHQIRVHLAEQAGTPLLGDVLYGRKPSAPELASVAERLGRQALHAAVLGFVHPQSHEPLRFEAPPPDDFRAALEALRALRA